MNKIIDLTVGLVFGSIFAIGLIVVLTISFVVLIPFMFYFIVKEVLKALTNK
jgi:F0F1-type ATP synthase membrane subunit b/b'